MIIHAEYGVSLTVYFPLIDAGATDYESTPVTHASGDTQVSKDGGAFVNTSNSFAHEGNGIYSLVLTAAEMQAKQIVVTIIDSATKAWEDQSFIVHTINHASALIPNHWADVVEVSGDSTAADNLELDYDGTGYNKAKSTIGTTTTNTDMVAAPPTAAAVADAVWDEAVSGHQTANTFGNAWNDASEPELANVATDVQQAFADTLLKTDLDTVEATAPVHSLTSALLKLVSRFVASTGITYRTDGTTTHMTQTPTTDSGADPITELGVAS